MKQDNLNATGSLVIELRDQFGNLKDKREVKNLVVTKGREYIASRMAGTTKGVMSHMAIGTGAAAAAAGDTTLGNQSARVALTSSTVTTTTIAYSASFPAGTPVADAAITEAGIFNDGTTGDMLCRTTFSVINKAATDSLTINWNVTINAA